VATQTATLSFGKPTAVAELLIPNRPLTALFQYGARGASGNGEVINVFVVVGKEQGDTLCLFQHPFVYRVVNGTARTVILPPSIG
jgi:hypothetical protein